MRRVGSRIRLESAGRLDFICAHFFASGILPGALVYIILAFIIPGETECDWYDYHDDTSGKS